MDKPIQVGLDSASDSFEDDYLLKQELPDLFLHRRASSPNYLSSYSNEQLQAIQQYVFSSIAQLHDEYLRNFAKRLQDRLEPSNSDDTRHRFEVDHIHRAKLKHNMKELVNYLHFSELLDEFIRSVKAFTQGINQELDRLNLRCKLQGAVCLNEAYYLQENVADELAKIVSPLFKQIGRRSQEIYVTAFYEQVIEQKAELIELLHADPSLSADLKQFLKVGARLNGCTYVDGHSTKLQNMSVDELISYINAPESPTKRNKKKKRKTLGSPRKPKNFDGEVEAFKQKLSTFTPQHKRLKPMIDPVYLQKWQSQMQRLVTRK